MITRKLWMYWDSGFEDCPEVVRHCAQSWISHNDDWDIVLLDSANIGEHVGERNRRILESIDVPVVSFSDVIRLMLVNTHGGLWVDSTVFCRKPLREYFDDLRLMDDFFCVTYNHESFVRANEKIVDNWFLYSHPGGEVSRVLLEHSLGYLEDATRVAEDRFLGRLIDRYAKRSVDATRIWFTPFVARTLGLRPYFWRQYLFYELLCRGALDEEGFRAMSALDASAYNFKKFGFRETADDAFRERLNAEDAPFYKLKWHAFSGPLQPEWRISDLFAQGVPTAGEKTAHAAR